MASVYRRSKFHKQPGVLRFDEQVVLPRLDLRKARGEIITEEGMISTARGLLKHDW